MRALVLAVHFLTIVRLPAREAEGPGALGRAAWWFPVVGLALGAAVAGLDRLLRPALPALVAAVLVVAAWKLFTGGLHLDGLADCLDGLGGRDAAARLAIMRDSRLGTFGGAGLGLVLLLGVTLVTELPGAVRAPAFVLAAVTGRLAPALLGARARPATPGQGSGAAFVVGLSPAAGPVWAVAIAAAAGVLLGAWAAAAVAAALLVGVGWTWLMARRLGGVTGDVLGAAVELVELGVLLAAQLAGRARA